MEEGTAVLTTSICWLQTLPSIYVCVVNHTQGETNIFVTFYKKPAQRKQLIAKYNCQHDTLRK